MNQKKKRATINKQMKKYKTIMHAQVTEKKKGFG